MENQKTATISPATLNRKSFVKAAPSLMKLLSIGNDSQKNLTSDFVPLESLNETTNSNHDDQKELAAKAAQEFEILTAQNDALFREKEQYKQKYDDAIQEMEELQTQLTETVEYKDEFEKYQIEISNYKSKIQIYEQEKIILQETIDDLKQKQPELAGNNIFNDPDIMDIPKTPGVKSEQEERLMLQVTELLKEKNKMEDELEAFKLVVNDKTNNMNILNQKLLDSENECKRLSNNLTTQQDKYIDLEKSKHQQRHRYARKMTVTTNEIEDENKAKQIELQKQIEQQKKKIVELERETRELQAEKFDKTKRQSGKGNMKHLRLRTKNNLFGGELNEAFDADPFGDGGGDDNDEYNGDEQEEFMNNEYSDEYHDDNGPVIIHGAGNSVMVHDLVNSMNEDELNNYIIPAHEKNAESMSMDMTQLPQNTSCGCLFSFFNKFKNKGK
eukprot:853967_1